MDFAVGPAKEHESASADIARFGIDDRQGEPYGDRRVNGIAALLQDGDSHLGSFGMHRRHHGLGPMNGTDRAAGRQLRSGSQRKNRDQKIAVQFHDRHECSLEFIAVQSQRGSDCL